jgi:hypothetical protein
MAPTNQATAIPLNFAEYLVVAVYVILIAVNYKKMSIFILTLSLGVGCLVYAIDMPLYVAAAAATITLLIIIYTTKDKEGFNTHTLPKDIINQINSEKRNFNFKQTIEGYEDVKKEKNENPAPVKESHKENMAIPFKLGELPSQVKNGPHLDASSTLMKALKSLDPAQINAMSKDTQQLIETQKSLMNMMGSMKPMLNDGKELMDTFQQMFGK